MGLVFVHMRFFIMFGEIDIVIQQLRFMQRLQSWGPQGIVWKCSRGNEGTEEPRRPKRGQEAAGRCKAAQSKTQGPRTQRWSLASGLPVAENPWVDIWGCTKAAGHSLVI